MADRRVDQFLQVESLAELAEFLNVTVKTLGFFAFSGASFYRTFEIPKGENGGKRKICAPVPKLKRIQRDLNEVLQQIYITPSCVHGFIAERSIVSNAMNHTGKRYIARVDLRDFFSSITGGRVRGLFQSNPFNFSDAVADALTNLVCYKGRLPQGAPTSPVLSNMICRKMDYFISRYAREHGIRYTRYADDLTFSSTRKASMRFVVLDGDAGLEVNAEVSRIIEDNGFEVNMRKTLLRMRGSRQTVTGIVVNKKCNFKRSDYRDLRTMFYIWRTRGLDEAINAYAAVSPSRACKCFDADGKINHEGFMNHIKGRLDFYSMIAAGNKKPSISLQRLWSSYYDLTKRPVPMALPTYSVYQTFADYEYTDKQGNDRSFQAEGTAFLLEDGRLVSAMHCICSECVDFSLRSAKIRVSWGEIFEKLDVSQFCMNKHYDTAVLSGFPESERYPALRVDISYRPQIGETIIAYGYAYESQHNGSIRLLREIRAEVSEVLLDGVYRVNRPYIQGMSGGPVLNSCGNVIGVITQGCKSDDYDLDGGFVSIDRVRKIP